jgi:uncharacterized membrane protein
MIKVDINRISMVGLFLGAVATALLIFDEQLGFPTIGRWLGPNIPYSDAALWMIFALLGVIVYLVGRIVWLFRQGLRP